MDSPSDVDTYLLDMELSSCGEASPYRDVVREHSVEFMAMDYDDERKLIGRARLHTLNTLTSRDPLMHLDEISDELVTLGHAALYAGEEKLDAVSPCAQTYVFVDSFELLKEYRGKGYGPYLLAQCLSAFFDTYDVAVLKAYPFFGFEMEKEALKVAKRKITKAWRSIGFKKIHGDVYAADIFAMVEKAPTMKEPRIPIPAA